MVLFESSWDTQSSNAALASTKPKGKKDKERRKSKDGGAGVKEEVGVGPSIDLDKLLKKMADVGGDEKDKGKGKGQDRVREKGQKGQKGQPKERQAAGAGPGKNKPERQDKGGKGKKEERKPKKEESKVKPATDEPAEPRGEKRKAEDGSTTTDTSKTKKQKKNKKDKSQPDSPKKPAPPVPEEDESQQLEGMSELQQLVRKNLQGSKFRIINEKLYKSSSEDAQAMMRAEPQMYTEYHIGFRHQTKSWPSNPVDLISTSLSTSLSPKSLIVDLGCGDAQLAKSLVPQGLNVLSFDLVSDNQWVIEADICTRIPLPGGDGGLVDACVCSLSLMSVNWIGCVSEAWRVLRIGGRFVVAEVTSRFRDTKEFVKVLSEVGFELVEQSAPSTHFLLFEFRKVEREDISQSWERINSSAEGLLKPCEYKRR